MLMTSQVNRLEVYNVKVQAIDWNYELETNLTKGNKGELVFADNPQYASLLEKYDHLKGIKVHETETQPRTSRLFVLTLVPRWNPGCSWSRDNPFPRRFGGKLKLFLRRGGRGVNWFGFI